jgi:Flp pilus assembly protein TadD
MAFAGGAKLHLDKYEESVAWLHRSIQNNRNVSIAHSFLAAGLAQLSRLEEARAAIKTGLALYPTFTICRFRAGAESDNATFLTQRERIY